MKRIIFTFFSFIITLSTVHAQNGINPYINYGAGGRLTMHVDSSAKNVYYGNIFPNQPQTSFNYLPDVDSVSVQMYFQKTENPEDFRYTILADNEPIAVNQPINKEQLQDVIRKDDEWKDEVRDSTTLGAFPIKDRTITILTYDIQRPQDIYKNVFYGKPIPKAFDYQNADAIGILAQDNKHDNYFRAGLVINDKDLSGKPGHNINRINLITENGNASLVMKDHNEVPRIILKVDSLGNPSIEMLDENGNLKWQQ